MIDYNQMLLDIENGTQGEWKFVDVGKHDFEGEFKSGGVSICNFGYSGPYDSTIAGEAPNEYDARRIERVPNLEQDNIKLRELLARVSRELDLIRMKDTGAVYDIMLRTDIKNYV